MSAENANQYLTLRLRESERKLLIRLIGKLDSETWKKMREASLNGRQSLASRLNNELGLLRHMMARLGDNCFNKPMPHSEFDKLCSEAETDEGLIRVKE